ncbi:MAG: lipid-A-disaccharide synthase [candidate division NC10 bacterium]|jgi:lipid-A-disaccharide synthase|nr:lipid-A-disaccharide synthase [candidate division NC10 bacterium]MCH7896439.1 lipid-A-disaccharide synthase [candidate division NC10 bacterium]MCZ6550776.1 lipid-A-disaccharide synthase [candidate division NC10 bacterium]
MNKKIFIVAGEASGDLHGADLTRALLTLDPEVTILGMGGGQMRRAGVKILVDAGELAAVGITEALSRFVALTRTFQQLRRALASEHPGLLILIDFPDFNFWLARASRRIGIPVLYYIGPQVWAWRKGRIRTLKRLVEKMLIIFPFEEALYREAGVPVTFVGHPMLDRLRDVPTRDEARRQMGCDASDLIVGLLPGSREGEVRHHLPVLIEAVAQIAQAKPEAQFLLAVAESLPPRLTESLLQGSDTRIRTLRGQTYQVMRAADLLIIASGTATLEAGLLGTPMIIIYRVSRLSWWAGRLLVDVPSIGMVNLVAGKRVVPELLQRDLTPERVAKTAVELLHSPTALGAIREDLQGIRGRLGEEGASQRAAQEVLKTLQETGARG